jgi:hypothetical protein
MRCLLFVLLACSFLFALTVAAQEAVRGPDNTSPGHIPGVTVLPIPGKPFFAHTTTEWTRTLADGNVVSKRINAVLARDSRGRLYREIHRFVPSGSKDVAPLEQLHLYDPVTRTRLFCDGHTFQCILCDYSPQTYFDPPQESDYARSNKTMTRELLGSDTIEGLYVTGSRETTTLKSGVDGNQQPLVSTREFWYSPELEINLAVTRTSPLEGKAAIRLSGIKLGEPDSHLWDVPIGFSLRDLRRSVQRQRSPVP